MHHDSMNAAIFYADCGYSVFPCRTGDKKPITKHGRNDATTDAATIDKWFTRTPKANVGLVTDGLVVVDLDVGGRLTEDQDEQLDLAGAPIQETPSGGRHFVFKQPPGRDYRNTRSRLALNVDTRANGGYIVVEPSSVNRVPYRWLNPLDCSPDALPEPLDWLVQRLDDLARVTHAVSSVSHRSIEEAIERTLPTEVRTREGLVFHFARELWAIYGTKDVPTRLLEGHVREWHRRALPNIRTKPFEETWGDFLYAWQNAKYPAGQEPISMIYMQALKLEPPECATRYDTAELCNLVALCRELQRVAGDKPFFLDCRTAGRLIGVDRQTANRWLTLVLTTDEVVKRTCKGCRGKASEYRYLPDL